MRITCWYEDGGHESYPGRYHASAEYDFSSPTIKSENEKGVGRYLHQAGYDEIDVIVATEARRVPRQAVIRAAVNQPLIN